MPDPGNRWAKLQRDLAAERARATWDQCTCHYACAEDPRTRCSLSGQWHVHPGDPCPVHPDAPGDR
jgi:hypothetical protein